MENHPENFNFGQPQLVPLRESQKAKGTHAKVSIGKGLRLLRLVGYFHHAALGKVISSFWSGLS